MKVLALDVSSALGSVVVSAGGRTAGEERFACERGRGAGVFAALARLRDSWRDADVIAVGVGPGSYNGLRTACALASSMQMATGARLCSAPSPCLLDIDEEHFLVFGDARGGRAYRAEVRGRKLCGEITLLDYSAATDAAKGATPAYRIGPLACLEHLPPAHPDAAILAGLAPALPSLVPGQLRPIYLKPPHITLPRAART